MTDRISITLAAASGKTFGVDDLACAAATDLGFWAAQGLDVTWIPVHGGVAAIDAVLDGRVDACYGGLGPAIAARADGAPVRIVVSMARGLAQNLVVRKSITAPDQLRGVSWALDGFGALSHHMARLIVAALGIAENEIDWRALGPPPERIQALLEGSIDVSLIRVEEAISLADSHGDKLANLLGFADLKRLVPLQPHGVLSTTEAYRRDNEEALARLVRGMILASRALHEDYEAFETVFRDNVTVTVPDGTTAAIWRQERDNGGFAVNGEMTPGHWRGQLDGFRALNPDIRAVGQDEILSRRFVEDALGDLGVLESSFDAPAR